MRLELFGPLRATKYLLSKNTATPVYCLSGCVKSLGLGNILFTGAISIWGNTYGKA